MSLPVEISKNDFFRLLKHKIPTSYFTRYKNDFGEKVVFKETIDALKQLDHFAQEIREDIWNADSLTSIFRYQEDQLQLEELCDLFNKLRLQKDLFPHPKIFNHLFFKSVYEAYVYFDQDLNFNLRMKFSIAMNQSFQKDMQFEYFKDAFIFDSHQQIVPWTTRTIPYERISQLITQVRGQIDRGMNDYRKQKKSAFDKLNQHSEGFDRLLRDHSSIYVFAIDIRIQGFFRPNSDSLITAGEVQQNNLNNIKLILARIPHLLSGLTKVEINDAKDDLNLHCILILKPSQKFSEKNSIAMLQQQIQQLVGSLHYVEIRNWNEVIRRNYSKVAVGLIKSSQRNNIEAFKYWILNFFFTLDLYIQPYLPSKLNHLVVNENLDTYLNMVTAHSENQSLKNFITVEDSLKKLEKANKVLSKVYQPFLSEKERKSVWSTRSLSKISQAYIQAVMHYYREIEPDPQKLQSMMNIEIFIETLVTTELKAFELSVSVDHDQLTRQILRKAVTRLGQQFLLLGENEVENEFVKTIQDSQLKQYSLFEYSRDVLIKLTSAQVDQKFIQQMNRLLNYQRQRIRLLEFSNRKIQSIRVEAYRKYKEHLEVATELFQHLLKQDCLILRLTVELIPEFKHIPQADLAVLWTAFLHQAQRAKPLSWKTGYFGLWRRNEEGHFYADIFIVFDQRTFTIRDSIIQLLNDKWVNFVNDKAQSKLKLPEMPKFKSCKIQGKSMMQAEEEYSSDHLLIEAMNKDRKSDFLKKIIPTFLSHSIFIENTALQQHSFLENAVMYRRKIKQDNFGSKLLIKNSIVVAARKSKPAPKSIKKKALKVSVDCADDTDQ